jgi:hypothetical protein
MDLEKLLQLAHNILKRAGAPHAIIGAFGMSAHGYHRATNDIDFLVDGEFRKLVEDAFLNTGFSIFQSNDEVLQLQGPGPIDIIFAKRPISKGMLSTPKKTSLSGVPVLDVEDIIGLKIQALANNPKRKFKDLGDIQSLATNVKNLDWQKIFRYADLFNVRDLLDEVKMRSIDD